MRCVEGDLTPAPLCVAGCRCGACACLCRIPLAPATPEELSVTMELLAQDVVMVLDALGVRPSRRLMAATVGRDGAQLSALLALLFR